MANSEPSQRRIEERMKFETMIRKQMGGPSLPWWCVDIKVAEVVKAVRHLMKQKAAGLDGIQPKHIKYGGGMLALYLSIAFTMFLRHSFVPHQFLSSVIVPINQR